MLIENSLRCDVGERDWSPLARSQSCPDVTDYGQAIVLHSRAAASFVCAVDTTLRSGSALTYGQSQAGCGMSCTSEPSGMGCSNGDGHGVTISRESYRIF